MNPKRWLAGAGIVAFAVMVAVFDMALTWPRPVQPQRPMPATGALGVGLADFASGLSQPVAIAFTPIVTDTLCEGVHAFNVAPVPLVNGMNLSETRLNPQLLNLKFRAPNQQLVMFVEAHPELRPVIPLSHHTIASSTPRNNRTSA
jgi:hypothetical protein